MIVEHRPSDEEAAYPHQQFVDDLLLNTPDSWDGDEGAEYIAVEYVRELERRVLKLGGTLERWPDDDDDPQPMTLAEVMDAATGRPGGRAQDATELLIDGLEETIQGQPFRDGEVSR
jgi:hypothetical protein